MARSSIRRRVVSAVAAVALSVSSALTSTMGLGALPASGAGAPAAAGSLDLRALGRVAALEGCATRKFVDGRPRALDVRYGMLQRTVTGSRGSFVLRNHAGVWRFCDMLGADSPSRLPLPRTTTDRLAVHLTNPDWKPICPDGERTGMRANAFLRVQDPVRSARTRFLVDGVAQPWFTSQRQGSIVHLQSWQQGLADASRLKIQTQLRDRSGRVLEVPGIPSAPRPMGNGCIQIG